MAMASVRSGLFRAALHGGSRPTAPSKRGFASSSHHDDAYETTKLEKITYLGSATCTVLAIYNLSKEKENLCLYGLPNKTWEVIWPVEEVSPKLPEPALGINFAC